MPVVGMAKADRAWLVSWEAFAIGREAREKQSVRQGTAEEWSQGAGWRMALAWCAMTILAWSIYARRGKRLLAAEDWLEGCPAELLFLRSLHLY